MAISQESMLLGPFTLGIWKYDCSRLISRVNLRKDRPKLSFKIEAGAVLGAALNAGLSILPDAIKQKIGTGITSAAPGFTGSIDVELGATPVTIICTGQPPKQYVGWDYDIVVKLKGRITTPAVSFEAELTLPFGGEGDREPCDCNAALKDEDLLAMTESITSANHEVISINAPLGNVGYGFLSFGTGVRLLAVERNKLTLAIKEHVHLGSDSGEELV